MFKELATEIQQARIEQISFVSPADDAAILSFTFWFLKSDLLICSCSMSPIQCSNSKDSDSRGVASTQFFKVLFFQVHITF